jgi:hypothetical protein
MTDRDEPAFLPAIRRARIESLNIYELSEEELELLERGSPDSLFLNFAVFLLSTGISLLTALLTTDIPSERLFSVFVVVTVLSFLSGTVLLFLWRWYRRSTTKIFEQIRRRMPPEGTPADITKIINVPPRQPNEQA